MDWIVSPDIQQNMIATFGVDKIGQHFSFPTRLPPKRSAAKTARGRLAGRLRTPFRLGR